MPNFFDQFDEQPSAPPVPQGGGNFFDQFDEPATPAPQQAAQPPQQQGRKPTLLPLKRVPEGEGILGSSIDFGPSVVTEAIAGLPGAIYETGKKAITAPGRAFTDPNFDPVEEGRNMAEFVAGGGTAFGVGKRLAGPVGDAAVLSMNAVGPPIKQGAQAVSRVATSVVQPAIDRVDVEGAMGRVLARRMMQQNPGMSFDDAFAKTKADLAARGETGVMADTGQNMQRLARNMAQGGGETAQRAKDVLGGRQAQEKTRMVESIKSNISNKDFYSAEAEAKLARKKSGPLFQRAYEANPNVTTPQLDLLLQQEPQVKRAMEKGLTIMRGEASEAGQKFDPATYGVNARIDADGNTIIDAMNGTPLKLWHATKRGVDKLINEKKNALGKLDTSDPDVTRLVGLRKSIDDELKAVTGGEAGDYAKANRIASEAYRLEDALDSGRRFARGDEEITQKMFNALSPKEKDAYRAGVAREMVAMIRKNPSDLTPAQIMSAIKDEAGIRKKLEFIVPSKSQFNNLMKDIENNLKYRETARGVQNVSQTGSIAMEEGQLAGENLAAAGGIAAQAIRGNPFGAITQTIQWGMSQLQRLQMPQRTRDQLGEMLLSQDPAQKQRALDLIQSARSNGWLYAP